MRAALHTRLAIAALVVAAAALLSFRWTYEADLFWHLAQGREVASGHLVRTNFFSATFPDHPQPATSWLFGLGVYELWQLGGATAVQAAQTVVLAITFGIVMAAARVRSSLAVAVAVVAFGFFLVEPRALPRPHTVSFAVLAACALLVEKARERRSAAVLLWAVPMLAVWGNVHVESYFGVLLLGLFAGCELARPSVLARPQAIAATGIVALSAAATLVNPYGSGLLRYLWENASVPAVIRIAELQPPYLPNYGAFFAYLAGGAGLLLMQRRNLATWEAVAFTVFGALALRHLRFTTLFFCATAPIVAAAIERALAARFPDTQRRPRLALAALAVTTGLLLSRVAPMDLVSRLDAGTDALVPPTMMPVGAMEFVKKAGLRGAVFNSNNIGGYMIWAGYPDVRVFQDSRLQAYPPEHFLRIMQAYRSQPAWDALVEDVDWAVLSRPRPNELSGAGRFPSSRWAVVYWDEASEVFVRRTGAFAGLLSAHEYRAFLPGSDPFRPLETGAASLRIVEARRNLETAATPEALAVVCLDAGDDDACDSLERLATAEPRLGSFAARLRRTREQRR